MARLMGTQEHFNSSVVQFVNTLNEAAGPALGALDDVERHREALAARERRMEGEMARMRAEHEELRTALGVLRQSNHDLAREIERGRGGAAPVGAAPVTVPATAGGAAAPPVAAFEPQVRRLRGSVSRLARRDPRAPGTLRRSVRRRRPTCSTSAAAAASSWRCWRSAACSATGIDVNESMVEVCRQKGLAASRQDALDYLRAQPAGSARRPAGRAGGGARRSGLPDEPARRRVGGAAAGLGDGARDHQPGVLVRVLRELHPRHHARAAAAPRHAEVSAAGQRLRATSRSATGRPTRSTTSCSGWRARRSATPPTC